MAESFLLQCKENYLNGITPSNPIYYNSTGYNKLIDLAKREIEKYGYDGFAGGFIEGQYLISLWVAHVLAEHVKPAEGLMRAAIQVIKDYSNNPLAPEVAEEEKEWLAENEEKYKEFL